MARSFLQENKVAVVLELQGDGTGTQSTSIVDTQGFESVTFLVCLADVDVNAVLTLTAQQNTLNSASGMATLSGDTVTHTATATSGDSKVLAIEVVQPAERYLRAQLVISAANATTSMVVAILSGPRKAPVTQDASVLDSAVLVCPAEA